MSPRISDAEWEVMHILWDRHPLSAQQVAQALAEKDWSAQTVKTLLARLVRKGAVTYDEEGRRYLYRPLISRQECVANESDSFLDRVFGGATSPLLAHFLASRKLSQNEIDQLKSLLDEQEPER